MRNQFKNQLNRVPIRSEVYCTGIKGGLYMYQKGAYVYLFPYEISSHKVKPQLFSWLHIMHHRIHD